ncbi:MAG TPA: ABC transporter permease/substrate-binding protein [Pyrinomonadaceae bacterium]|jgi:osmoprotectant transport system permease protein|nr:ABC transporter permease/substrate-binding protein [Pyrinomonadaceae bacterium]
MSAWEFCRDNWADVLLHVEQHLWLVLASTSIAVVVGVPTGILLTRRRRLRGPVLGLANIMQTVPSLALFGLLIPIPFIGGIGRSTAIIALVLYALLPVIRNTVTGILGVDRSVREAAVAMGMTDWQVLWQVELPLAMRVILTGIRVAMVITIGVAVIAAAVGAGGLGEYIFRGLRQFDNRLLLAGAVPSALMALVADFALGLLEKRFDTEGKRSSEKRAARFGRIAWAALALVLALGVYGAWRGAGFSATSTPEQQQAEMRVRVGSKDFTESVLLGEIVAQMLEARGVIVERRFELGGSLAHQALVTGQIDCYPEYTGTSFVEILKHAPVTDPGAVYAEVQHEYAAKFNVEVSAPLGYSNDFAILVRGEDARRLGLKTISDAVPYAPRWRAGFGQDFMSRADGYAGFARAYGLKFSQPPREMDLSLTYRALASNQVDIIAGNSTDGLIAALDLVQLADDRRYFPPYEAVVLARRETMARVPALGEVLRRLSGRISTDEMRRLNQDVDGNRLDRRAVARAWIARNNDE